MPVADVNNPQGPDQWFKSLPIITRSWFGVAMVLALGNGLGVLNAYSLVFNWGLIGEKFEIWRFATSFCYPGGFAMDTLILLYLLVTFSRQYEDGGPFNTGAGGGTADYAFSLLFGMGVVLCSYPFLRSYVPPVFCKTMVFFVLYLWSRKNPTANANIWGIPVSAMYLPFAYMALSMFLGQNWYSILHGIAAAHLYYFLVDVYPAVYGRDLLKTPQFLIDYFGVGQYDPARQAPPDQRWNNPRPQPQGGPQTARGYNWGAGGQRLGRD